MIGVFNEEIFQTVNGLSGRSLTFDTLLALAMDNPVAKAGPVVACFAYAWWKADDPDPQEHRRKILLVTLAVLFIIAPTMKVLSTDGFAPRPLLRGEQVYLYSSQRGFEALPRLKYRPPATGDAAVRHEALREHEIESADVTSFPSDHAALFLALAVGILVAEPIAGSIALGWVVIVTLGARVIVGMHSPLDVLAGGAIGIGSLLAAFTIVRPFSPRLVVPVLRWSKRWPGWTAGLMTLLLMEVASAMSLLESLAKLIGLAVGVVF